MVKRVRDRESSGRQKLRELGIKEEVLPRETSKRKGKNNDPEQEHECEVCRASLFLSMLSDATEETVYCLQHGFEQLQTHPDHVPGAKILYSQKEVS